MLYQWTAAMQLDSSWNGPVWGGSSVRHRGICPIGWHVPSDAEWGVLLSRLVSEGDSNATRLMSPNRWTFTKCGNCGGSDDLGFHSPGSGYFESQFQDEGIQAFFWSADEDTYHGKTFEIARFAKSDGSISMRLVGSELYKGGGASLRCIEDPD